MSKNQASKSIEMKISTVVAVSALLRETDPALLDSALKSMTGGASDYFDNEFTVIDLAGCDLTGHTIDWPALINLFKSYSLNPVAVRHAPAEMEADIAAHGLSIDVVARPRQQVEEEAAPAQAPEPAPAPIPAPAPAVAEPISPPSMPQQSAAMIVDTPVRAGQRIYARGADLIVTAVVNSGAELIADGSIHIYAPLRGRALAGASGNADARIFALSMEAELISIAGTYRTFENGLPKEFAMKPAQVRLDGDRIDVLPIHTRA
ncbi:MAG TPA: septum site-determining protein MinC [Noviherbaspirillum sp.]|jgi:septum site-determining protein MinC|uniref:septum site-determining protein MinC n=1 Tax=Noviherbaspirillum sp. TaxID=1926288 RepID=UPI002DDCA760|nr:septum site-determining protein MinC [Noviherbaspirillum sp.]HEV2611660.1 septum site-determining protein MinC [Noviherbaspirillum sp.]